MRLRKIHLIATLVTVALVALAACRSDEPEATVGPNPTSTPRPTAVPSPAITPTTVTVPGTPTPVPTPTPTPAPPDAAIKAVFDLAARLSISPNSISITSFGPGSWPDSSYGCPEPGHLYAQVVVEGWDLTLSAQGQTFEYHADSTGEVQVNCTINAMSIANAINIVELAGLREATSIEMRRRDATGEFVLKSTVTVSAEIDAILDTLDVPLQPVLAASCTEVFRLVFVKPSGTETIGTICGGNTRLVRGSHEAWAGEDANAPNEFNSIIGPYFSDEPLPTLPS